MAKNRIAALSPALTTTRAPDAAPSTGPAGPSAKELKAEIGTFDTEKSLRFEAADKKEIQERLQVLRYYNGAIDGSFNEQTRLAIAEWQKKREVASTGMLGPVEVAALRAESEETYQRYLDSQPEKPDAQPENPQATPSVQTPATGSNYQPYHTNPTTTNLPLPILPLPAPLRLPLRPAQALLRRRWGVWWGRVNILDLGPFWL